eukprot:COSAG02_NODE_463_length_21833_cov_11.529539_3_plen_137_part_00
MVQANPTQPLTVTPCAAGRSSSLALHDDDQSNPQERTNDAMNRRQGGNVFERFALEFWGNYSGEINAVPRGQTDSGVPVLYPLMNTPRGGTVQMIHQKRIDSQDFTTQPISPVTSSAHKPDRYRRACRTITSPNQP